jgi:hypothetical protein
LWLVMSPLAGGTYQFNQTYSYEMTCQFQIDEATSFRYNTVIMG